MSSHRSIRLFLSSTFRDFGEERDLLVKRVFPALRAKLRDRFVELVDVDLRWGITAEEAERGEVLPICLAEIDRARPYFIGMLGERYGWIPPPDGYAADLLERQPWLKKHQGGKSVTELEILHGVLNNRRMQGRAFFYFRSPRYSRTKGGDYLPSLEDRTRQTELKRRIRERGLPVTAYANPEALAKRIERDLWKLLDAEFPASEVPDAYERERLRHEAYAAPRRRLYLGGERYQTALNKLLDTEEPRIVVEGASGGGKSALLANFLEAYRKRRPRHLVHEHYLGASTDAADPHALVRRLIEFIQCATGSTEEIPGDPQKLMDSLPIWLATASAWARKRRTRFIFVLDSLNSLTEQQDLRWWPAFLPKGVTMLVSCLSGPVMDALKGKTEPLPGQDKPPKWKTVTVRPMKKALSARLLNTYLARFNKKLPASMVKQVQAHTLATNPLFLRTLAEELRLFGVHEELQKRLDHYLSSQTFEDLFERLLARVEKECGKQQVKAAMTAIWASRAGLTEKEILGIANLMPAHWAAIRHAVDEALLEKSGRLTFAHKYLRIAVNDRYLRTVGQRKSAHHKVANWFAKTTSGARRVEEEPYQWLQANDWGALKSCLLSWDTMCQLPKGTLRHHELRRYWVALKSHYDVELVSEYAGALHKYPVYRHQTLNTADFLNELGIFLMEDSVPDGLSERLIRRAISIKKRLLGPLHSKTFYLELNLVMVMSSAGRFSQAERLIKNLLKRYHLDKIKGLKRLNHAELMLAAGSLSHDARRFEKAENYFRQATAGYLAHWGPHHEDTLLAESNLVGAMLTNDKVAEARPLLETLCRIAPLRLGPQSPVVLLNEFNLAKLLADQGQWGRAERAIRELLRKNEALFGQRSANTARDVELLGLIMLNQKRYSEGMQCYKKALDINVTIYGKNHPKVAQVLANIADAWFEQDAYLKAEKFLRKVVLIIERTDPGGSRALARYCKKLGIAIFMSRHTNPEAGSYFERALSLYQTFAGPNSNDTINMMDTLGNWLVGMSETEGPVRKLAAMASRGKELLSECKRLQRSRRETLHIQIE